MNTKGSQEILRRLALDRAINRQLDALVRDAAQMAAVLKPDGESKMEESQIRNVINVSQETGSVEVLTNFIRYQIGRRDEWQYNNFGVKVFKTIEEGIVAEAARKAAEDAAREIAKRGGTADKDELCQEAYPLLAAMYLGYLGRAFQFCKKVEEENKERKRKGQPALIDDPWAVVVRQKEVCKDV